MPCGCFAVRDFEQEIGGASYTCAKRNNVRV